MWESCQGKMSSNTGHGHGNGNGNGNGNEKEDEENEEGNGNLDEGAGLAAECPVTCGLDEQRAPSRSEEKLPGLNLPEKIVFVIDTAREKGCTPFKLSTGSSYMPLVMIKRIVENFVCIKSMIQRSHEYALMILKSESAEWICDFTSNANSIMDRLNPINEDFLREDQHAYDFGQLFEKLRDKLPAPLTVTDVAVPTFVTRVILAYSRSNCIPNLPAAKLSLDRLAKNPYFFIDALYVHEPPSPENSCELIYSELAKLDTTNFSYILETGRNAAKLHDNMAKLLAHPLQRPPQKDACYSIYSPSESRETYANV